MTNNATATGSFWDGAEIISSYSRAQAIEDGALIDLTEWASPREMRGGFNIPVAVTAALWAKIENIPASKSYQDIRGRAHDVLWMASLAARKATGDTAYYRLILHNGRRTYETLKMHIGPGDDGAPVITIMLPEED